MRQLLRSKVRFNMKKAGYTKPKKPRHAPNCARLPSFFAQHWREFC